MADKFINETGVATIRDWVKTKFATTEALQTLSDEVDEIIAEGGEPNVIDTVKVNGTALVPDAQKAVDVTVPTKTSDLTNDSHFVVDATGENAKIYSTSATAIEMINPSGDALSFNSNNSNNSVAMTMTIDATTQIVNNLATTDYVDANGGKIDVIKVNGTAQTITNKEVDLAVAELSLYSDTGPGPIYNNALIETGEGESIRFSQKPNDTIVKISAVHNGGVNFISGGLATNTYVTNTLANYYTKSETYTQSEVDSAISSAVTSAYKYKGSVATIQDLPSSGQTVGDVYDVQATGVNYAWNGTTWDALGSYVDTSLYWTNQTGQTNTLEAMTVAEINTILNASA